MVNNPLYKDLQHILQHTKSVWLTLKNTSIFLTGGTGFFGSWLLEALIHANTTLGVNMRVTVLTRNPTRFREKCPHLVSDPMVTSYEGDVRHFAFPEGMFPVIIHAATEASASLEKENPDIMESTIVDGSIRVLEFARRAETRLILNISSGAVYGTQSSKVEQVSEDYPLPSLNAYTSAYARGKRISEQLCATNVDSSVCEIKIARCFAFVGPYLPLDRHFAIGNFIRNGLQNNPIIISGDGSPRRSYLYAADLVIWLLNILVYGKAGTPYNVGSEHGYSILQIAEHVSARFKSMNIDVPIRVLGSCVPGAQHYVPSTTFAHKDLGLTEKISLSQAIQRTVEWHLHL